MNATLRFWLSVLFFFTLLWVYNRTYTHVLHNPNREGQELRREIVY